MEIQCPACGSDRDSGREKYADYLYGQPGSWETIQCGSCSLVYIWPQPADEELSVFYDRGSYYSFSLTAKRNRLVSLYRKYSRRLLLKNVNGLRCLDFGCGDGEILYLLKNNGADVFGIEFGDGAEQLRRATGLEIYNEAPDEWRGSIDFIRGNHSLEHVKDPVGVLKTFKELLRSDKSVIKVGVPNINSWAAKLFGKYFFYRGAPVHTVGFSPESLKCAAEIAGLTVVEIRTIGGLRGWLGSLLIATQNFLGQKSKEPSTKMLLLFSPIYLPFMLVDVVANLLRKGHLLEVTLSR